MPISHPLEVVAEPSALVCGCSQIQHNQYIFAAISKLINILSWFWGLRRKGCTLWEVMKKIWANLEKKNTKIKPRLVTVQRQAKIELYIIELMSFPSQNRNWTLVVFQNEWAVHKKRRDFNITFLLVWYTHPMFS